MHSSLASSAPSFGGNQILPSFITRKETKPSSWLLQGLPLVTYPQKFKFGSYYLSFFEYGETSTVLASKKLWKESPFVFSTLPWSSGHKFSASPSFFSFASKKMPAAWATALQACPKPWPKSADLSADPGADRWRDPSCVESIRDGNLRKQDRIPRLFRVESCSRGSFEPNRFPSVDLKQDHTVWNACFFIPVE